MQGVSEIPSAMDPAAVDGGVKELLLKENECRSSK